MLRRVFFSSALLLLTGGLFSILQAQHWTVKNYTIADGLPFSQVNSVVQDPLGYLWFAGSGGIVKFDGEKFRLKNASGDLESDRYVKIISFRNLIFALPSLSSSRIVYYLGSQKFFIPPITRTTEKVVSLSDFIIDTVGNSFKIIVATYGQGVYIHEYGEWHHLTSDDGLPDNVIFLHKAGGVLYAGTDEGLFTISGKSTAKFKLQDKLPGRGVVLKLFLSNSVVDKNTLYLLGVNWLGKIENNRFELINNDFNLLKTTNPEDTYFESVRTGYIFFGNEYITYLYDLEEEKLMPIGEEEGMVTNGATDILVDRENNVWLTSYRGINRLTLRNFNNINSAEGLLEDEVTAVTRYGENDIFLGHANGFSIINGSNYDVYKTRRWSSGLMEGRVLDALSDDFGNVYFICQNIGLGVLNNKSDKITWLTGRGNQRFISALMKDQKFLLGAEDGLYIYEYGKITKAVSNEVYVRKIIKGSEDEIILCTKYDGIGSLTDNSIKFIKGKTRKSNNIYAYHRSNVEFVGTAAGLYYVNNNRLERYDKGEFSINRPVFFIEEDSTGGLWFGTDAGVYYKKEEQLYRFSTCNGLAGLETNRSAFYTNGDQIFIGTNSGLSLTGTDDLIEGSLNINTIRFKYLEDSEGYVHSLAHDVSATTNDFVIDFDALTYSTDNINTFSVKLFDSEGGIFNEQIIDDTKFRVTDLKPGSYRVQLKYVNDCRVDTNIYKSSIIRITPSAISDLMIIASLFFFTGLIVFVSVFIGRKLQRKNSVPVIRNGSKKNYQDISQEILINYEDEKAELSNNLRDGLAQILAGVNYRFDLIGAKSGYRDQNFNEVLSEMTLVRKELLKVINGLHPVEIERYGLKASLENLFDKYSAEYRGEKEIIYTINLPDRLHKRDIMIYRILEYFIVFLLKNFSFKSLETVINSSSDSVHVKLSSESDIFMQLYAQEHLDKDVKNKYKRFKTLIEIAGGDASVNIKEGNFYLIIPV